MRKDITVSAAVRETHGKGEARRLRRQGKIPAVLYGSKQETLALEVSPKEVSRILHSGTGHNTLFNLQVDGREKPLVMIVDWQYEPVKDTLLHVDFKRVDPSKKIAVMVPIGTDGDPKGVKQQGGLLEIVTREVGIECLPDEIPERFVVDVRELMIGQNIRAADLQLAGSMKLTGHADTVLVHVIPMRGAAAAAEEAPAAAAPAEPEVVKKGKKEEEEK